MAGNTMRNAAAEALGTFILVLTITSTAVAATLAKPLADAPYDSLAVPVAGGLTLAVLVASLGHTTGAPPQPRSHPRPRPQPAVPLGPHAGLRDRPVHGGISAAAVTWAVYGNQARTQASLGATYPAASVGPARVFAAEAIVTSS